MAPSWLIRKVKKIYQSSWREINARHVHEALENLYQKADRSEAENTLKIPFEIGQEKFIILSDQHRGNGNAADDFNNASNNYINALNFYFDNGYTFINLGDSEECWKYKPSQVLDKTKESYKIEIDFFVANRYYKIFGNHDNDWAKKRNVAKYLHPIFGDDLCVYEAIILTTKINEKNFKIFLAHGQQGDDVNDKAYRWTKWKVRFIWAPLEKLIHYNPNKANRNYRLKDGHNKIMYNWISEKEDAIFIAGHTHIAVFESLNKLEELVKEKLETFSPSRSKEVKNEIEKEERTVSAKAPQMPTINIKPSFYNTGCCCFSDGDITGIEIENGQIRLITWQKNIGRTVKQHASLEEILNRIK